MKNLTVFCLFFLLISCKARYFDGNSEVKLISAESPNLENSPAGTTNFDPKYSAAIRANVGHPCSATIVGKHAILTALHCVVPIMDSEASDDEGRGAERILMKSIAEGYMAGDFIDFNLDREVKLGAKLMRLKTIKVEGIPSAFSSLPAAESIFAITGSPDLAVIHVEQDLSSIGIISPNYEPLEVARPIVVSGWGCEFDNLSSVAPSIPRFKTALNEVLDYATLKITRAESFKNDAAERPRNYFFSGGFGLGATKPKSVNGTICSGDSGGGVYVTNPRTGNPEIVGVNSAAIRNMESPFAFAGAHVRISTPEVKAWLQSSTGFSTTQSTPISFKRNFASCFHKRANIQDRFQLGIEIDKSGSPNRVNSLSYREPKLDAKILSTVINGNDVSIVVDGSIRFRDSAFELVNYKLSKIRVSKESNSKGIVTLMLTHSNGSEEALAINDCELNFELLNQLFKE